MIILVKKQRKAFKALAEDIVFNSIIDNNFEDQDDREVHYNDFVRSHCGIHGNIPTYIFMQFEFMDSDTKDYIPCF